MESKVNIQTHQFEIIFNDGARVRSYAEDYVNHEADSYGGLLVDGMREHLDRLGKPGVIKVQEGLYRPHGTIRAIRHLSSDVTSVLTLEFDETHGLWKITSEE